MIIFSIALSGKRLKHSVMINHLTPSGNCMYHGFNINKNLYTQCLYVFCVDLIPNSNYTTLTD